MIRTESEYKEAVGRLSGERDRLAQQESKLAEMGLSPDEIDRATAPARSFMLQLQEEVEDYERLNRGDFDEGYELESLRGIGTLLIRLRISAGLTQKDLAERLHVHESQVSRDERNEYHGITLQRAGRILDALGADLHLRARLGKPSGERPAQRQPAEAASRSAGKGKQTRRGRKKGTARSAAKKR